MGGRFARKKVDAMQLHLSGHLAWYDPQKRSQVKVRVPGTIALTDLLRDLGIPVAEIAITVVNGAVVDLPTVSVTDADRVELFPPVGGG
jgi:sulfur carrier protein ThiS